METLTIFMSDKEIMNYIMEIRNVGFDQIRLPGGTDKNFNHYSGIVVFRKNPENKETYFLGVPYNSNFYKTQKEDRSRKVEGESVLQTARRELFEETGLVVEEEDLKEIPSARFVGKKYNKEGDRIDHIKYFFLCPKVSGNLAEFGHAGNPIEGETGSPIWIPGKLFKQVLSLKHQNAFNKALELMAQDKDLYLAITHLL